MFLLLLRQEAIYYKAVLSDYFTYVCLYFSSRYERNEGQLFLAPFLR